MFESNKIIINQDIFSKQQVEVLHQSAKHSPTIEDYHVENNLAATGNMWCDTKFIDYSSFQEQVEYVIDKCKVYLEQTYKLPCELSVVEFIKYEAGGHYATHIDGQYLDNDVIKIGPDHKDLSCILYLNDDYEGGELTFNFFNKTIRPKSGQVITFPSNWRYLHKVSTITSGERYAIVIWFKTTPAISVEEKIDNIRYLRIING
jgi:predicted 2-oxoglutarate/Fe(II)-dependent dioxygenase YbiX